MPLFLLFAEMTDVIFARRVLGPTAASECSGRRSEVGVLAGLCQGLVWCWMEQSSAGILWSHTHKKRVHLAVLTDCLDA